MIQTDYQFCSNLDLLHRSTKCKLKRIEESNHNNQKKKKEEENDDEDEEEEGFLRTVAIRPSVKGKIFLLPLHIVGSEECDLLNVIPDCLKFCSVQGRCAI